jgi:hypothetical protein
MQGISPTLLRIKWIGDLYVVRVTSNNVCVLQIQWLGNTQLQLRWVWQIPRKVFTWLWGITLDIKQRFIKNIIWNLCYKSFMLKWNVLNVQTVRTVSQLYDKWWTIVLRHLKFGMVGCFICQHISYISLHLENYKHCDSTYISGHKKEQKPYFKGMRHDVPYTMQKLT